MPALYNLRVELNQPAPNFQLPDLNGRLHHLDDYRGRIVIVNFWSAECPWSQRTDLDLTVALRDWGGEVVLLTLAADLTESMEQVPHSARERQLNPVLLAGGTLVAEQYDARTTPHIFIVDADGLLRYRGAPDDVTFRQRTPTRHYVREAVEALRSGGLPDPAETPSYGCSIVRHLV